MVVFPLCDSISLDKLHYIWSDCAKTVHSLWFVQHHINGSIFKTENNSKNTLQASPDFGEKFPHLLTKMGSKTLVPPSLTTKNRVKLCQILSNQDKQYQRFLALKSPGKPWFSGVFEPFWYSLSSRLTLAELRCATSGLETVLLKVLGSKILYLSRFLRVIASFLKEQD